MVDFKKMFFLRYLIIGCIALVLAGYYFLDPKPHHSKFWPWLWLFAGLFLLGFSSYKLLRTSSNSGDSTVNRRYRVVFYSLLCLSLLASALIAYLIQDTNPYFWLLPLAGVSVYLIVFGISYLQGKHR